MNAKKKALNIVEKARGLRRNLGLRLALSAVTGVDLLLPTG